MILNLGALAQVQAMVNSLKNNSKSSNRKLKMKGQFSMTPTAGKKLKDPIKASPQVLEEIREKARRYRIRKQMLFAVLLFSFVTIAIILFNL